MTTAQTRVEERWRRRLAREAKLTSGTIAGLQAAARQYPRSAMLAVLRAVAFHRAALANRRVGQPIPTRRAERLYRTALGLAPSAGPCWEGLAALLDIQERYPEAAAAARRAMLLARNTSEAADAIAYLSRILAQQGKRRTALRWAKDPRIRRSRSWFAKSTASEVISGTWHP